MIECGKFQHQDFRWREFSKTSLTKLHVFLFSGAEAWCTASRDKDDSGEWVS